jgi:hypothetical protein
MSVRPIHSSMLQSASKGSARLRFIYPHVMIMHHLISVQRQHRHGPRCVIDTVCEIRSTLSVAGTLPRLVLFPVGYVALSSFV